MANRILMVRLGGLGDLLVILPSLQLLRRAFPRSKFSLVCRSGYGLLLKAAGLVEEIWDAGSGRVTGLFSADARTDFKLQAELRSFDQAWIWNLQTSGSDMAAVLRRQGVKSVHALGPPSKNSRPLFRHYFCLTAEALGVRDSLSKDWEAYGRLKVPEWEAAAARAQGPAVVIHPGSGSRKKCWPLENFLALAERLAERKITGLIVTGEAESWLEPELKNLSLPSGWDWVPQPPLLNLGAWLSACRLYLGNDSGITHLAAACGARGFAFFRKEALPQWKPYGRIKPLGAEEMADITSVRVGKEIDALV